MYVEGGPPAKKARHEGAETSVSAKSMHYEEVMKPSDDLPIIADDGSLMFAAQVHSALSAFWNALVVDNTPFNERSVITLPAGVFILGNDILGSSIFVRDCYPALLKATLSIMDSTACAYPVRHVITLGNPGIGKTYFSYFLLAHIARIGGTVVYESGTSDRRYLLSPNRIAVGLKSDFSMFLDLASTYYIVDATRPVVAAAKTVLLTSPRRDRWWEFHKIGCTLQYMPVWSEDEIQFCRSFLFPNITPEVATDRFRKWGGVPRYVLMYAHADREQSLLKKAIESMNLRMLIKSIGNEEASDEVAHRLVHMTVDETFDICGYRFASDYVAERVYRHLLESSRQQLIDFLAASCTLNSLGALRGALFERHAHVIIPRAGEFNIRELKDDKSVVAQSTLSLAPRCVVVFKTASQISSVTDSYLLPQSRNFESVDSIIKANLLFQMTVTKAHPCKQAGLHRVLNLLGNPPNPQLYFVVPMGLFDSFEYQKYADANGKLMKESSYTNVKSIRQFVLGISLAS